MLLFDHPHLAKHMMRARPFFAQHDFLWRHAALAMQERLLDIKRDFTHVAESSCAALWDTPYILTPDFLPKKKIAQPVLTSMPVVSPSAQEHEILPFQAASLDGYLSLHEWQWINDLPGLLLQIRTALRPDGVMMATFFGGDSLHELRHCMAMAEMDLYGGASPRVSPFINVQDMASLMQRAQFALPVVDRETVTVTYGHLASLVADLRYTGQNNALIKKNPAWRSRAFWHRVETLYRRDFATAENRLKATVEMIYVLGWAPDASQPQPLKRGSATHALADILQQHAGQNGIKNT